MAEIFCRSLCARMDVKFFVNSALVIAKGMKTDAEAGADFLVKKSLRKEGQDFLFSSG